MSSPSPDLQSGTEHAYQTSENSDHVLIPHPHTCSCSEKINIEVPKSEISHCFPPNKSCHHHNVINLNHAPLPPTATNHTHPANQAVHVHVHASPKTGQTSKTSSTCNCHVDSTESSSEVHDAGINVQRKLDVDDRIEVSPLPPALPPRPPPRARIDGPGTLTSRSLPRNLNNGGGGIRKYVFWCCACGGLATILGALFLAVYFLLRSYTSTLGYFETIPTFVPATMLILTGLCVISLARRKNRYSYLIKVCGLCCLVCALTCVLVTITTTVIHMNRLQTLRECVYTQKTRTCTCYSVLLEAHASTDEGMRFVFDSTPDCEVIHGALYSCLRAMFGLSVSGILVCIFSCMLVYQLLSHEKKKMYWEQLELRCRSLYQQHGGAGPPPSTHGSVRGLPVVPATYCSCCEECRYPPIPSGPQVYPWDSHHTLERFWTPGRVGNFYSPNPGEEGPQTETHERERSGWNWRRLPWTRGNNTQPVEPPRDHSLTYQGSSDSQYGFTNRSGGDSAQIPTDPLSGSSGSYSLLDNRPMGAYVWGPPPPYSNPNSPARRPLHSPARYHHIHHHPHAHNSHCQLNQDNAVSQEMRRGRSHSKDNYENTTETEVHQSNENSEGTDTSSCMDRVTHTLPVRKMKKRADLAVKAAAQAQSCRSNVQNVFNQSYPEEDDDKLSEQHGYHEPNLEIQSGNDSQRCRFLPRLQGVENAAFQNQENCQQKAEPTESEVYFADVSSCCNISVKNDGQDSSLYDEALEAQKPRLISLQCVHNQSNEKQSAMNNQILKNFQENISSSTVTEDEDYLAHRMGDRQMSIRSRLPFPLPNTDALTIPELNADNPKVLTKDLSQNSLCSSIHTPMTETTDDAVTPTTPDCCINHFAEKNTNLEQMQKHRTFSNSSLNQFLAPDAQYEIIQEQGTSNNFRHNYNDPGTCTKPTFSNLTNTISGLNNYTQNYFPTTFNQNQNAPFNYHPSSPKNIPPKNINQSPNRRNLGTNISTLIQNLGVNSAGLLYGEANSTEDEELQGQGCHSDGTMDSGWQSGSENKGNTENVEGHRPVNV